MNHRDTMRAMITTRTVVGYLAGTHVEKFRATRTTVMADVTAPAQADQIIAQGLADWALVLDDAGLIVSEHGDAPSHALLGLPPGRRFTVRGRRYVTDAGAYAASWAHNGTEGVRYEIQAWNDRDKLVAVRFDAQTSVFIDMLQVLISLSGVMHAADQSRPSYFLCGAGGKFGAPNLRASRVVQDFHGVDCKRCRVKIDNLGE